MSHPTDPPEGEHGASGTGRGSSGGYEQYPSTGQHGGDQGGQYGGGQGGQYGGDQGGQYGGGQGSQYGGDYQQAPGYQQGGGGFQQAPKNGLGIAALILGIIAILSCWTIVGGILFGIIAIILGFVGRGRVKKGVANNGGVALAGIITGVIGLIASVVIIIAGVSIFNSVGGGDLISCVKDANGDQAKVQQCQDQFSNRNGLPTT